MGKRRYTKVIETQMADTDKEKKETMRNLSFYVAPQFVTEVKGMTVTVRGLTAEGNGKGKNIKKSLDALRNVYKSCTIRASLRLTLTTSLRVPLVL